MSPSTLDILSSSSYPIPERLVRGRRGHVQTTPDILYGGLTVVPDESVALSAGNSRQKKSSSKSSNKSGGAGDGSKVPKRKRGRPRVLDKDENAAERRRTQIRLAQRAYRSRKEATISLLNERLADIDAAIQDMGRSFGRFHDELIGSGLVLQHSQLGQHLHRLAEKSDALVRLSGGGQEISPEDVDAEGEMPNSNYQTDETASNSSLPDIVDDALSIDQLPPGLSSEDLNALYTQTDDTSFGARLLFQSSYAGYGHDPRNTEQQAAAAVTEDAGMQMITSSAPPSGSDLYSTSTQNLRRSQVSLLQQYELPLPSTYSFHEPTFARRLRRQCIEYGYRLLTDSRTDPKEILRVFQFSLAYKNRQELAARFGRALSHYNEMATTASSTGQHKNQRLVSTTTPYFTVGNAGMHYTQARVQQGSPTSNPGASSSSSTSSTAEAYPVSKLIGPWPFHLGDLPLEATSIDELLAVRGMSGDWFDSNDVESYLNEIGVPVEAQSRFVAIPSSVSYPEVIQGAESDSSSSMSQLRDVPLSYQSSAASEILPFSSSSLSSNPLQMDPRLKSSTHSPAQDDIDFFLASSMINEAETMEIDNNTSNNMNEATLSTISLSSSPSSTSIPAVYPVQHEATSPLSTGFINNDYKPLKQNVSRILDVESFINRLIGRGVCLGEKAGYRKQDVDDCLRVACYTVA